MTIILEIDLANGQHVSIPMNVDLPTAKAAAQTILDHGYVTEFTLDRVDHIELVLEAEAGLIGGPVGGPDTEAPVKG